MTYVKYKPPILATDVILLGYDNIPSLDEVVFLGTPPPPPINFIFNDNDKVRKQPATDITFIFGEPIPPDCSPIRNGNNNNFDCRCAPIISTDNNFMISCNTSVADFGFIESYHGESVWSDFIRTSKVSIHDGSTTSVNIDYRPQLALPATFAHGSTTTVNIQANAHLYPRVINDGSTLSSALVYRIQPTFPVVIQTGSTFGPTKLSYTDSFIASFRSGENVSFNITPQYAVYLNAKMAYGESFTIQMQTYPSSNITVSAYSGESINYNLNISPSFMANGLYGENISSNVTTKISLNVNNVIGDTLSTSISYVAPIFISPVIYHGDTLSSTLASTITIKNNISYGENVLANIRFAQSTGSEVYARHGENVNVNIITYGQFKSNSYFGSTLTSILSVRPPEPLLVRMYHGTNTSAHVSIDTTFSSTAQVGENFKLVSMDNLKNTYLYYGENVITELSSEIALNNNRISYGDHLSVQLKTGPSEPLGTFRFYDGTAFEYILTTQISTYFSPIFSFNTEFVQTIWDTTFIDMNRIDCCPPRIEDLLHVNLQRDKEVEVRYDIPRDVSVTINMRTNPIFYPKMSYGDTFAVKEYDMLLSAHMRYGDIVNVYDLYNDLVVDLNSGNPEYGDDDVLIETNKAYTEFTNTFTDINDGTEINIELSVSRNLYANMYIGQYMRVDEFQTIAAWRLNFYGMFGMRWQLNNDVKFYPRVHSGETFRLTGFYEDPITFGIGENMFAELITDYDVEFVDSGCLDNGHIPTTSEGIPIYDPTNEMAVEGQYYSRYIRGRCF